MMQTISKRSDMLRRAALVGPVIAIIGFFMVLPLGLMAYVSFLERGLNGGVVWGNHTGEAYIQFLFERDLDDSLPYISEP